MLHTITNLDAFSSQRMISTRQGRTALDLCEDPEARNMLRKAYKDQVQLRLDRWGETGLPPVLVNAPKGLQEQQMVCVCMC
jgi:hypothetical protein